MAHSQYIEQPDPIEMPAGRMHSAPADVVADLYATAGGWAEDGIYERKRGEFIAVVPRNLIGSGETARIRHPVRLRVKGR